jgi:hypothetical protein
VILRRVLPLLFAISLPLSGWAQGIIQIGIPHTRNSQAALPVKNNPRAGAKVRVTIPAVKLPFWEDFSTTKNTYPDTNVWLYGNSVRVNNGMAIDPPSLKVATFDGVDSVGSPYNVTDILAKGYADKLISGVFDLTTVAVGDRGNVWMSYMYEMKGNGEMPDGGDRLLVMFYDKDKNWIPVDTIENDGTIEPDIFYSSNIQIDDDKYFHADFKFRIQNFARLSGPYDTWHVDYIYINKGRIPGTSKFDWFPDRTITALPSSIFGVYRSIPVDHFLLKAADVVTLPTLEVTNLNNEQVIPPGDQLGGQPLRPYTNARIGYKVGETETDYLTFGPDSTEAQGIGYKEFYTFNIQKLPDLVAMADDLNNNNIVPDSIGILLQLGLDTDDNNIVDGDFDPAVFGDIDFRANDTTSTLFSLVNKYAYDDGTAEYGAGLNQPGAQVAYKYELIGVEEEDVTYLELYFPRFGDESSQVIELRIWDDLQHDPIYREVTTLQRSSDNKFWKKKLTNPVHVDTAFYIGWKQSVSAVIAAGLDKNTDTGDRMWSNTSGGWQRNTFIHGSLMMRPIFGEGAGVVSGLEDEKELVVYPNPSSGTFYFNGVAEMISVYDMTGRSIPVMVEANASETKLTVNASQGIYVIKAYVNGLVKTAKVMIR